MGQLNLEKGNHIIPPENSLGIGFNSSGKLVRINADGSETIYEPVDDNPQNVVANKGIGLDAELPAGGIVAGDTYVTTDTFRIYIALDSVTWDFTELVDGQFVTDVLNDTELPPLYQYYNSILMPIANYKPEFTDPLPE